ncbi:MAG: stage V sporulation protein S [Ardenticatenales bacterium]|nr:stage V sporulation protein S [Ardenticatenales bacterium]
MTDMIKVSANSLTTAVAGAIAGVMRDHGKADVQAIGASAVNQAVKAIAIARGYLEGDMIDIACIPHFVEVDINGQERTALRFTIEQRPPGAAPVAMNANGVHASHHHSVTDRVMAADEPAGADPAGA